MSEDGEVNDDANMIFGTYLDRDSSDKPQGIKKMLKVITFEFKYMCVEIQAQTHYEVFE